MLFTLLTLASASTEFPGEIHAYLSTPCTQQCTTCHATNGGGTGTVNAPFGMAMQDRGLQPGDIASLHDALDQMQADAVDSDADGVSDVDALIAGLEPNTGEDVCGGGPAPLLPTYGCLAAVPMRGGAGWLFLGGLAALVGLRRD